jgi:hypothetical protein
MEHTLQDFELVLRALQNVKEPHAWVGGQAVIVWANRYLSQAEIESTGLQVPLSSKDGDLKANAIVAKFLAKELGAKKQDYRLKDESRGMAWGLIVSLNGQQVLFDILEKLPGVDDPIYVHTVSVGPRENRLTARWSIRFPFLSIRRTSGDGRKISRPLQTELCGMIGST